MCLSRFLEALGIICGIDFLNSYLQSGGKMNNIDKYLKILHKNKRYIEFYETTMEMLNFTQDLEDNQKTVYNTTICVTSPVLISYVMWVVQDAIEKKIETLYFLARDGYIMYKIALEIIDKFDIDIECKYLLCSRMSLRKPLYFIDSKIALDLTFTHSLKTSIDIILKRLGLDEVDRKVICAELQIDNKRLFLPLSKPEIYDFRTCFEKNKLCKSILYKSSEKAYNNTIGFFSKEGILDEKKKFALVDSGWTGSIQMSFRIILEYYFHRKVNLEGYYFGITSKTKNENGIYNAFYINENTPYKRFIKFNNNVFEVFCSANHGMTTGYDDSSNDYSPMINTNLSDELLGLQFETIVKYTKKYINKIKRCEFDYINTETLIYPLLRTFMYRPDYEESQVYGGIKFCDDSSEDYLVPLAKKLGSLDILRHFVIIKVLRKLRGNYKLDNTSSNWVQGSVGKCRNTLLRQYFRSNYYLWDFMKLIANRIK